MKSIVVLFAVLLAQQSFACMDYFQTVQVCPGDVVYKGSQYSKGATVLGINRNKGTVTVRSLYSGNVESEVLTDLYITKGCLGGFCVQDLVFKSSNYSVGAGIVAINPHRGAVVVRSMYTGNLNVENPSDLYATKGCLGQYCVGNVVYKGSAYSLGATIVAINAQRGLVVVKSLYTGNLESENPRDLYANSGCTYSVCVGDTVYKGSAYSLGARVIAVNQSKGLVVVKSMYTGNLESENPQDLSVTDECADYSIETRNGSLAPR